MALSTQQEMVMEQLQTLYQNLQDANDSLSTKASTLLSADGVLFSILALIGFERLLDYTFGATSPIELTDALTQHPAAAVVLAIVIALFVGVVGCSYYVWGPTRQTWPGKADYQHAYEHYISVSLDEAYAQSLSNIVDAIKSTRNTNVQKGRVLTCAVWLFVAQVSIILLVSVAAALGSNVPVS